MDLAIVLNAGAGNAAAITADALAARIAETTGRAVTVYEVRDDCDPLACARRAVREGARVVVAAGGDGTVSACATVVAGTAVELGVLPLGTSNSFAAALEIPTDLDAAIANLARADRRQVDAAIARGAAGERLMILHCMIGLHADTIATTATDAKRRWGVLAYAASALRALSAIEPFVVAVATGPHQVRCRAVAVAAANVAPAKTVLAHGPSHLLGDDGKLDVTIVAIDTLAEAIATGVHLYRSALAQEPASRDNVGSFSARTIAVTCEPPQRVIVDGEDFGETPITLETVPGALVVIAPPAAIAEGPAVAASLLGLPDLEIDGVPVAR